MKLRSEMIEAIIKAMDSANYNIVYLIYHILIGIGVIEDTEQEKKNECKN